MKREQASLQVRNHLHALATRGELKPGDRLPTERELARHLGISRATLREGIVQLTTVGVLESIHGVGTFIAEALHYGPLEALNDFYGFPVGQMFEARFAIEPHIASLAAERATKEQIDDLGQEVKQACGTLITPERFQIHDLRFHRLVALASGNPVLAAMIEVVTASTIGGDCQSRDGNYFLLLAESIEMHRKIYRAIRSRDSRTARITMERHFGVFREGTNTGKPQALANLAMTAGDRAIMMDRTA